MRLPIIKINLMFRAPDAKISLSNPKITLGLTLVEMLIVTVILSVISLAVYATFNNGIKIWQRVNQGIPQEDVGIFFDKFAADLRNGLKISGFNFLGEEYNFRLGTIAFSPRLKKPVISEVAYSYDPNRGVVERRIRDYSQVYSGDEGLAQNLLSGVKSLKFQYYCYDGEKKEYLWQDEWAGDKLPWAVRMKLELENDPEGNQFVKTVFIPAGG